MNIGGGEAADQVVRMILSGEEVAIRLTGSAIKNVTAIVLALAKNHKKIYGRTSLGKMLRETRDIRVFPMSKEQYRLFRQEVRPDEASRHSLHPGRRRAALHPQAEAVGSFPIRSASVRDRRQPINHAKGAN